MVGCWGGMGREPQSSDAPVVLELGLHVLQPLVQALQPVQDAVQRLHGGGGMAVARYTLYKEAANALHAP